MRATIVLLCAGSMMAGAAACTATTTTVNDETASSSSGSSGDGTSSGSSGEDGTSSSSSGSSGDGASSGASGSSGSSGAPSETKSGTITIMSTHYAIGQTPIEMGSATGTYYRIPPVMGQGGVTGGCTETKAGACIINACTFSGSTADSGAPSITYTDAGPVKVTGVLVNDGTFTMTPGGYGYVTTSGSAAFFMGGESIHLKAPGKSGGAPAFDVTLTAPSSVRLTAPSFDAQGHVFATPSQSLGVAWQSGGAGNVVVQLASGTQAKSTVAKCTFASAAGQGSVPSQALAAVAAVGAQTSLLVTSEASRADTTDGWNVTIALQAYALRATANGTAIASGLVTFQ